MATIVILEHLMQRDLGHPYMIYIIAERWRTDGHKVIVHHGLGRPPPGDVAVMNVDATVIPDTYMSIAEQYPVIVNGRTQNIGKRHYSQLLVNPDSAWDGQVMIKTNANYGGRIDQELRRRCVQAGMESDIPAAMTLNAYPIVESIAAVPGEVWESNDLIVEKFLPEKDERGYYVRVWIFLGDNERSFRDRAAVPRIKSHRIIDREKVAVPDEIRQSRRQLGFDFGKFDYVVVDGRPVLLDANRTPGMPKKLASNPDVRAGMDLLAAGLYPMFPGS